VERLSTEKERLEWRRNKVLELSSEGRSQPQIANMLRVGLGTVNRDLQYLRQQAKENIRYYLDEKLPFEYQKSLVVLDALSCKMWDIVNNAESQERDRLSAASIVIQAVEKKIDLLSAGTVVDRAVQFVERNRGLTDQNGKVRIDVTAKQSLSYDNNGITESKQNTE
jgi:hypothetical protein